MDANFSVSDLGFLSTLISEALQFLQVKIEDLCSFWISCVDYIYRNKKIIFEKLIEYWKSGINRFEGSFGLFLSFLFNIKYLGFRFENKVIIVYYHIANLSVIFKELALH